MVFIGQQSSKSTFGVNKVGTPVLCFSICVYELYSVGVKRMWNKCVCVCMLIWYLYYHIQEE